MIAWLLRAHPELCAVAADAFERGTQTMAQGLTDPLPIQPGLKAFPLSGARDTSGT
ncbi:hypothetical protein DB30_06121 [Enhygromyxa salina]|uniref:Uncharacterized protein n=1 Tax=Enhygromyxa salina TaxID=215803 RepID=A0A0C1ZBJ3_9BACT|nr:hypothetical protein DB30_06121 [Enhygromyxa salina]